MLEFNTPFLLPTPSPIGEGLILDFFSSFSKIEKIEGNRLPNGLEDT